MNIRKLTGMAAVLAASGMIISGCAGDDGRESAEKHTSTGVNISQTQGNTTEATTKPDEHMTTESTEVTTEEKTSQQTDSVTETTTAAQVQEITNPAGNGGSVRKRGYDERVEFHNAAFLGDSRTAGLDEKLVVSGADFYTSIGISVKEVLNKKNFKLKNGAYGTMLEAVSENEYERIYLMFGINELGWPGKESFVSYYSNIVRTLKNRFPNTKIYVQSILPMVEKRTDEIYNNEKIRLFNTYVREVADKEGAEYIDVCVAVQNQYGTLPEEASNDGIHLSRDYCFEWAEYLKEQTEK